MYKNYPSNSHRSLNSNASCIIKHKVTHPIPYKTTKPTPKNPTSAITLPKLLIFPLAAPVTWSGAPVVVFVGPNPLLGEVTIVVVGTATLPVSVDPDPAPPAATVVVPEPSGEEVSSEPSADVVAVCSELNIELRYELTIGPVGLTLSIGPPGETVAEGEDDPASVSDGEEVSVGEEPGT